MGGPPVINRCLNPMNTIYLRIRNIHKPEILGVICTNLAISEAEAPLRLLNSPTGPNIYGDLPLHLLNTAPGRRDFDLSLKCPQLNQLGIEASYRLCTIWNLDIPWNIDMLLMLL